MVMATPGMGNTYVLDHDASGRMRVEFSRDEKSFAVNKYAQIIPVKKEQGYYLEMGLEEAARVVNADGSEYAWPDGQNSPDDNGAVEDFEFKAFKTKRKAYPFPLGDLTVEQASWDIMAQHLQIKKQLAMTARTMAVQTVLQTAGNYAASHTSDVSAISGNTGNWAASTTARQDIKRSINFAARRIMLDTLGVVTKKDLKLVIGPDLAHAVSESQEIVDYIKSSPNAVQQITAEINGFDQQWELPTRFHGVEIVVEDAVKVTNRKGGTRTSNFVLPGDKAMIVSRVGGLVGVADAPNFSTVVQFMKEEMTVEKKHEVWHRKTLGRVTENFEAKMVAPVSGFLFTNAS